MNLKEVRESIKGRQYLIEQYNKALTDHYKELCNDIEEARRLLIIKNIRAIKKNRKEEKQLLKLDRSDEKSLSRYGHI